MIIIASIVNLNAVPWISYLSSSFLVLFVSWKVCILEFNLFAKLALTCILYKSNNGIIDIFARRETFIENALANGSECTRLISSNIVIYFTIAVNEDRRRRPILAGRKNCTCSISFHFVLQTFYSYAR